MRTSCSLLGKAVSKDATALMPNQFLGSFKSVVTELGGNSHALLKAAGISHESMQRAGERVSLRAIATLLENTARELRCPDLGLRLAERQNIPDIMKPLDELHRNAPTVGASMRSTIAHMAAYSSGVRASLETDEVRHMRCFSIEILLGEFDVSIQMVELLMLLTHNTVRFLSRGNARSREVHFSHLRVSRSSDYTKRFGCAVKFGQAFDSLYLSEADFNCQVVECNRSIFESESRRVSVEYPAQPPGLEVRVRLAIARALAESVCTREEVAALLGMHSRTLQRRLSHMGMRFELIRDDVRRNLAVRYLARADLRLTEVGGRLGYSEPAVLSRSCRRWFAATPSEFRRNLMRHTVAGAELTPHDGIRAGLRSS